MTTGYPNMHIHNYGSFVGHPVEEMKYYKEDVSRYTRLHFRRANRFVLLSLAGACRCAHEQGIGKKTAVYLTTENGNLGDTETVLHQIFHMHQFPMPYNFINTMSNTASFYVAQSLELLGRNVTFSSKLLSFERGLELTSCDMEMGAVEEALIGGVDEASFSKEQFEAKFDRNYEDYTMVEGSCWLLIRQRAEGALGRVSAVASFAEIGRAVAWLKKESFDRPVKVAHGILMTPEEKATIGRALPDATPFDAISEKGYFDSAAACAATTFLERFNSATLIHINKDTRGHYALLRIEKY